MKHYRYILLLIILLSTISFGNTLKQVSLQLQWKHQFQFAGYIIAKEKGFYKDIGLNLHIKEWHHGIDMVDEVINQQSEYSIVRPSSMINIANGKEIVYLATIFQSSPLILLADKSSNIKSVEDFKNKKIMTTGDIHSDTSLLSMMFSQGVKFEDLNEIPPSFNVQDLLNGTTDLMASYISNEPYILKELGGDPVIFSPKDYGFDFYNDILITTQTYLKDNPQEVKNFKYATLKGWEYAFNNINEAVDILYTKYNSQNKSKDALKYEAEELKKLAYYKTNQLGKIEKSKLEKTFEIYKLLGLVQNTINFNTIIYDDQVTPVELTKKEKEYLLNKGSITMCIDPNWMPFEAYDEKGQYIGISSDYYQLFQKTISTPFEIIKTDLWEESLNNAKQRKCDILSLVMETPERKKYLNFTTPYLTVPLVVATKLDTSFINDTSALKDKKIGIPKGYAFVELLKNKYPDLNIIEVDHINDGLEKVKRGTLDGYIGTFASVGYGLQKYYQGELKIAGKLDEDWSLGIGVRNDDPLLLSILQKAVNNLTTHQKEEILNKWVSVQYEKGIDYTLIWFILSGVFLLGVLFFYKQYLLDKENKQLEQHLNHFKDLMDSTIESIIIFDNNKCIDANEETLVLYGFNSKDEILGKTNTEFTTIENKNYIFNDMLNNEKPYEATMLKSDGSTFPALLKSKSITFNNKKMRVLTTIDLTELKKKEKLLHEQSKLVSMGEMIGNIAHQWRQPLSMISIGATNMMYQKEIGLLDDNTFQETCNNINDNAQFLSKTIDDFKNYIKGDRQKVEFNLSEDINSFITLVQGAIKNNDLKLELELDDTITINGYPNELIQCLINIFNNSKDALKESPYEDKYITITTKTLNKNVIITIKDNAGGIPSNILPQIFEPYFTTKHKSQGTGLGLSMTYNLIVDGMHGKINAKNITQTYNNQQYKGAEFEIILPQDID